MNKIEGEKIDHDTYHRLEESFVQGYRAAQDKLIYLRLAHIPIELPLDHPSETGSRMHLKSVKIVDIFEVGNVSPAFGSNQLIHQMYPDELVENHKSLKFIYVHHDGAVEKSLHELFGLVIEDGDHHN